MQQRVKKCTLLLFSQLIWVMPAFSGELPPTTAPKTHTPGTAENAWSAPENLRSTSSIKGGTGLLHIGSARLGSANVFRVSVLGEYFSKMDFPVLEARNTRSALSLSIDWVFHRHAEAYLSYTLFSNNNNQGSPSSTHTLSNLRIGLQSAIKVARGIDLGADLQICAFPGTGDQESSKSAVGFAPKILASVDFREYVPKLPLLMHFNMGAILDKTQQNDSGQKFSVIEEYALQLHRYHRLTWGAALEAPLPYATAFLEYELAYPLNAKNLLGSDQKAVTVKESMPQTLSAGLRITAFRNLSILAAIDVGLTKRVAFGIPATPPFQISTGITYHFQPVSAATTNSEILIAKVEQGKDTSLEPPLKQEIHQALVKISLQCENQPIAGKVRFEGAQSAEIETSESGSSIKLPRGYYIASIESNGFISQALEVDIPDSGEIQLNISLTKKIQKNRVKFTPQRIQLKKPFSFELGKTKILPTHIPLLGQVIDTMASSGSMKIVVEGHTDNHGNNHSQQKLSQSRAQAVADYLIQHGIDSSRVSTKGCGDTRPIAPNLTERGKKLNRRVEILMVEP